MPLAFSDDTISLPDFILMFVTACARFMAEGFDISGTQNKRTGWVCLFLVNKGRLSIVPVGVQPMGKMGDHAWMREMRLRWLGGEMKSAAVVPLAPIVDDMAAGVSGLLLATQPPPPVASPGLNPPPEDFMGFAPRQ